MRNTLRVFLRDLRRILHVPKVWAIVIGLIIMPSLYAWVNIVAFWDPYSNTEDVKVAIVNQDRGATSSMTGELNVGDQVVAQLRQNHQLGWQFVDEDEAMTAVRSGESYAAIVIPPEFSEDLLSIMTGDFVAPELRYYVNEKVNAISPKITGVGASTLDTQINSTFVSTVAETIAKDLEQAGVETGRQLLTTQNSTLDALDDAVDEVQSARDGLVDIEESLTIAEAALGDTRNALLTVDGTIGQVQSAVDQAQTLVAEVQEDLVTFTDSVTSAYVTGAADLADASSKLNRAVAEVTAGAQQANVAVGSAITDVTAVVDANEKVLDQLEALLAGFDPEDPVVEDARAALEAAIAELEQRNADDRELLGDLEALNVSVSQVITEIQAASDAINTAVQDTSSSASSIRGVLIDTIPGINRAMSAMSASAGAFSSALGAQQVLVGQAVELLTGLEGQLEATVTALEALDANLEGAQQGLANLRTDVAALSAAEIWSQVHALTGLDPERIAEFMASPVEVKEHNVFPVATYGSAMAPLFTNLSLWIGAFMLVVLLKQEVDTEGVDELTVRQAYLGRFMLLAMFNVLQTLLVSIGNVIIGVQMASAVAFVGTTVFVGLVYLSIIYALALSFGYVGKGIAILLVIMQIPGASGIYPIEMMPPFFQALFPFFPFTYGIDAMRETIGGFYGTHYLRAVSVLLLFAALAFTLGIFLRQRLGNFARLFNRKIADTGLFVPEDVQILGSRRRLTQIAEALSDRASFRERTRRRAAWFKNHHLTLLRLALLIGIAVTAVLACFGWFFPASKSTMLGLWGILCLLVIGFVVALEYIKQNIVFAAKVGKMPEPELQKALVREEAATHSSAVLADISESDNSEADNSEQVQTK